MDTRRWAHFPYPAKSLDYAGNKLEQHWPKLHAGDREPFPDEARMVALLRLSPESATDDKAAALAAGLQDAWRAFHRGDFAAAVNQAEALGLIAHAVANKAAGIYADYLEEDDERKLAIYEACVDRAEAACEEFPEEVNAWYLHAFALGRYSQGISVAKALAQGLGGKIKTSLSNTLELESEHAEAHTAMALYHAEIIDKVGKLVGSMTYGASADKALKHFERALELTPEAPIAQIEYGNGLYLLFGDKRLDESNAAYAEAAAIKPLDAMQKLDVEYAKASIDAG